VAPLGTFASRHGLPLAVLVQRSLSPAQAMQMASSCDRPDFTFHSLRHSCATFLIKQGEQQRTVVAHNRVDAQALALSAKDDRFAALLKSPTHRLFLGVLSTFAPG